MNQIKTLLLSSLFSLGLTSVSFSQDNNSCNDLQASFLKCESTLDSLTASAFLSDFPKTFCQFQSYFGKKEGCLRDSSLIFIKMFNEIGIFIKPETYYEAVYEVSINGKYEVDGSGCLQYFNHEFFKLNIEFVKFLETKSKKELCFYFSYFFDVGATSLVFEQVEFKKYKKTHKKIYKQIKYFKRKHEKRYGGIEDNTYLNSK